MVNDCAVDLKKVAYVLFPIPDAYALRWTIVDSEKPLVCTAAFPRLIEVLGLAEWNQGINTDGDDARHYRYHSEAPFGLYAGCERMWVGQAAEYASCCPVDDERSPARGYSLVQ